MERQVKKRNVVEVLDFNSSFTEVMIQKKHLYNKYQKTVNLFGNFTKFFDIARENNYTDDEIKNMLKDADENVALVFCSSLYDRSCRQDKLYREVYPQMLSKLVTRPDYLFLSLFKHCYWYFTSPIFYYDRQHDKLSVDIHLDLIYPYLKKIYDSCGEYLYKRCRRGYNIMFEFFVLFQEYMDQDQISYFFRSVSKKILAINYAGEKQSIIDYLRGPYIRRSFNVDEMNAVQLLFNLL